jgi:hypothetical protein
MITTPKATTADFTYNNIFVTGDAYAYVSLSQHRPLKNVAIFTGNVKARNFLVTGADLTKIEVGPMDFIFDGDIYATGDIASEYLAEFLSEGK